MIATILQKRSAKAESKEAKDRKKRATDEVQNQTVEDMRSTKTSKLFQPSKGILDVAIADFVHAEGAAPAAVHSPRFRKVLETDAGMANRCPPRSLLLTPSAVTLITSSPRSKYIIPTRKRLNGDLLDAVAKTMEHKTSKSIREYSESYGFAIMADGATIHHVPLFNILDQTG